MFSDALFGIKASAGLFAGLAASSAIAATPLPMTTPSAMPLAAVGMSETVCMSGTQQSHAIRATVQTNKSAAIMGGQMSALERMKMAQNNAAGAAVEVTSGTVTPPLLTQVNAIACEAVGVGQATNVGTIQQPQTTGQFLGTERVQIGRTRFDASWNRISNTALSRDELHRAIGAAPRNRDALLAAVNRWVNRNITYRDDRVQYGANDFWADARTTLDSRVGDCEDYAILKMQMLAAAGIDRKDMMLTLARDTVKRVDHAVLLVRDRDGWVMLDMGSDRVAPANLSYGYRPVVSFADDQRFLHGKAYVPSQSRVRVALN